ncbi:hypothetical protein D3C86_2029280 [compost metagenome]
MVSAHFKEFNKIFEAFLEIDSGKISLIETTVPNAHKPLAFESSKLTSAFCSICSLFS